MDPVSELEWLLELSPDRHRGADRDVSLERLVAAAAEHLSCLASAVVLQNGRTLLVRSRLAESLKPRSRATLRHIERTVLGRVGPRRGTALDRRKDPKRRDFEHPVLLMPIKRLTGQRLGTLVFIRSPQSPPFDPAHLSLAQLLGRHVATVLETQFDPTTGLYTRAALHAEVKRWVGEESETARRSLLCLKIDHVHVYNEVLGFEIGDRIIGCFAGLLTTERLPPGGLGARISGTEFAVALPRHGLRAAARYARVLQQAAATIEACVLDGTIPISVSCGVAPITSVSEFPRALALAEVACRIARDRGPGRVEIYDRRDDSMLRRSSDPMKLARLRSALQNDRLTLYAHKILPLQPGRGHEGYELLLRAIDDPDRERAPAWVFSAAESYQMESALDQWVIDHALEEAAGYQSSLLDTGVSLSINISGKSLADATLFERVKSRMRRLRFTPALIIFEITETAAASSVPAALDCMNELRSMGCRFALDDFGTGVNSLKTLKNLTPDRVKIDGGFITDLLTNEQSVATIRAIVRLAQDLGIETVAEYAESRQIISRLRELGVHYAQGDGVERPRPLPDVLAALSADASRGHGALRLKRGETSG